MGWFNNNRAYITIDKEIKINVIDRRIIAYYILALQEVDERSNCDHSLTSIAYLALNSYPELSIDATFCPWRNAMHGALNAQ
jgi:hypothetical protein